VRGHPGSAAPPSCCGRCMSVCSSGSRVRPSCSPTRRRRRCSIPDAGRPRPANCGLRTRRSPLGWRRPAWRGVCLRPRSQGGAADRPSRRVHGHPSGRIRSLGWKSVRNFAEIKPEVELLFGSRLKRFVRYLMSLNETSGAPRLPKRVPTARRGWLGVDRSPGESRLGLLSPMARTATTRGSLASRRAPNPKPHDASAMTLLALSNRAMARLASRNLFMLPARKSLTVANPAAITP